MKKVSDNILSRVYMLFGLFLLMGLMIIFRVVGLQFNSTYWSEKELEEGQISIKKLVADRGNILDEKGTIMATSIPFYKIALDPSIIDSTKWDNFDDSLKHLSSLMADQFFDLKEDSLAHTRVYQKVRTAMAEGDRHVYLLRKKINFQELQTVKNWPILRRGRWEAGLVVEKFRNERFYPFNDMARITLGKLADDTLGIRGIEHSFNKELRGRDGYVLAQKVVGDSYLPLDQFGEIRAHDGYDITTTLDVDLQDVVESALKDGVTRHYAKSGTAILIEVETGKVKALANYPETYNQALATRYEPGSTFKIASATALLQDELFDVCDSVDTGNGKMMLDDKEISDNGHAFGVITLEEVIKHSSNIGISKVVQEYFGENPERFYEHLKNFGFYQKPNQQIKGEPNPLIIEPGHEDYTIYTLPNLAYGYSIGVTAMQMAAFYNGMANKGKLMRPWIVKQISDNGNVIQQYGPEVISEQMCSPEVAVAVREMMKLVVKDGTAKRQFRNMPFEVAGKTGTAKKTGKYGYIRKYRASFGGFFPANEPRYTLFIMVDEPDAGVSSGASVAAPIFRRIAQEVYRMDNGIEAEPLDTENSNPFPNAPKIEVNSAKEVFASLQIPVRNIEDEPWIQAFVDSARYRTQKLEMEENIIPDLKGMTSRDAINLLENMGVEVILRGIGRVRRQSLLPGYKVTDQARITLFLS
ncbi:MAG: penicillin-binding protein [Bacteroidota bacterium]